MDSNLKVKAVFYSKFHLRKSIRDLEIELDDSETSEYDKDQIRIQLEELEKELIVFEKLSREYALDENYEGN